MFAQKYPRVEKTVIKDKLLHGRIDKYPITIYLKFNQSANLHAGAYSVKGWYYYNKVKTKIALSGLYNHPKLTLYNFKDTTKSKELLTFSEMKSNHWKEMEYYENLTGFNEKLILSDEENFWMNESKKLEVILNQDDLSILNFNEFLFLDTTTVFDLHNFFDRTWDSGFEIIAHENGRIILQYLYGSNFNYLGMCGGGVERGFLTLEFDHESRLVHSEKFVAESCYSNIWIENQQVVNNQLKIYNCNDYRNNEQFDLIVDLRKVKVEIKIKN